MKRQRQAEGGPARPVLTDVYANKHVQIEKSVSYKIVKGDTGDAWVEVRGEKMSPSQVNLRPDSSFV